MSKTHELIGNPQTGNSSLGVVMPRFSDEEIEEDYDLQDCPNCGSDAVGYDGTGSVPFLECFQCDHNWIP